MASGHMYRAYRPNTWLHRPATQLSLSIQSRMARSPGVFLTRAELSHQTETMRVARQFLRDWVEMQR
jgi:hypothetical protein